MGHEGRGGAESQIHLAAEQVLQRRARALVGHVHHADARGLFQLHARHMLQRTIARRRVVEFRGVRLGVGHQLLHVVHGQLAAHHDDLRRGQHIGHWNEVGRLPGALGEVGRDHMKARVLHQQGVAVGFGALDLGGRDVAVAAALVLHHDRLTQHRAQGLRRHARGQIGGAAGGGGHHHVDGLVGVVGARGRRAGKAQGQTGCQSVLAELLASHCHCVSLVL